MEIFATALAKHCSPLVEVSRFEGSGEITFKVASQAICASWGARLTRWISENADNRAVRKGECARELAALQND